MNDPYGLQRPRYDAAAWHDYQARNHRCRTEYRRHPIATAAYCTRCGNYSPTDPCIRCLEETP